MKKLLLIPIFTLFFGFYQQVQASRIADALDAAVDKVCNAVEDAVTVMDRAYDTTNRAYDNFGRSIDRAFNSIERAVHNVGRRAKLSVEIAKDYHLVTHCERAFFTTAAVGVASALAGCPLAPLFCGGAKLAGGLLAGSYIKLCVDKAIYRRL